MHWQTAVNTLTQPFDFHTFLQVCCANPPTRHGNTYLVDHVLTNTCPLARYFQILYEAYTQYKSVCKTDLCLMTQLMLIANTNLDPLGSLEIMRRWREVDERGVYSGPPELRGLLIRNILDSGIHELSALVFALPDHLFMEVASHQFFTTCDRSAATPNQVRMLDRFTPKPELSFMKSK
jgi:hypothetical protein